MPKITNQNQWKIAIRFSSHGLKGKWMNGKMVQWPVVRYYFLCTLTTNLLNTIDLESLESKENDRFLKSATDVFALEGVIVLVISNPRATRSVKLKLLACLLPELYSAQYCYHYLFPGGVRTTIVMHCRCRIFKVKKFGKLYALFFNRYSPFLRYFFSIS